MKRRYLVVSALLMPAVVPALPSLTPGWNLLGNSDPTSISVASTFNQSSVISVWKWNKAEKKWALYSPSLTHSALADYAEARGYDVLSNINPKEGYWVNAAAAVASLTMSSTQDDDLPNTVAGGATLQVSDLSLGWNLLASADHKNPSDLNAGLGPQLTVANKAIVTAWAWDAASARWRFYAPSLEAQGSGTLSSYIATNGYLPFTTALSPTEGFWMNVAQGVPVYPTTTVTATTSTTTTSAKTTTTAATTTSTSTAATTTSTSTAATTTSTAAPTTSTSTAATTTSTAAATTTTAAPTTSTTTAATTTSTAAATTTTTTATTTTTTVAGPSAANGKVLYNDATIATMSMSCANCHTTAPSANVSKVLNGANNATRIQTAIANNTGMMGIYSGKLSTSQLNDIAAYLATPNI